MLFVGNIIHRLILRKPDPFDGFKAQAICRYRIVRIPMQYPAAEFQISMDNTGA